jgi:hypothetical protein
MFVRFAIGRLAQQNGGASAQRTPASGSPDAFVE